MKKKGEKTGGGKKERNEEKKRKRMRSNRGDVERGKNEKETCNSLLIP